MSDSTPAQGAAEGVSGNHYGAFEVVQLEFHSVVASLGTVTTDSKGSFSTTVQLPAGATGSHEIVGTGLTTGDVASASLEIGGSGAGAAGGSNGGSGGGSGSGGLSSTGVAVIGIGALGVVLLAGGGMLLLAGKRRRPTAI